MRASGSFQKQEGEGKTSEGGLSETDRKGGTVPGGSVRGPACRVRCRGPRPSSVYPHREPMVSMVVLFIRNVNEAKEI